MTQTTHRKSGGTRALGVRLQAYAATELAQAAEALGQSGLRRHEGVHLARRHLRRVRGVLTLGRKPLDEGGRLLDHRLRNIVRSLARVRDAQAMLETLDRLGEEIAPRALPRGAAVRAALRRNRDALMAALLERDPGLMRLRCRLQALQECLGELAWTALRGRHVDEALRQSRHRLRKAAAQAKDRGKAELRHRWRRRWRRLRQQSAALQAVGRHVAKRQGSMGRWGTLLGEEHDLLVLRRHLARHFLLDASSRAVWEAVIKAAAQRRRALIRDTNH